MRPLVVLLALAALAAATPMAAFADPGNGHGRGGDRGEGHGGGGGGGGGGGWRGEGRGERGGPPNGGQAPYGNGRWREEGPPGRSEGAPPYGGGRWGYAPPSEPGQPYGEPPPRGRNSNSLGQYYREQQDQAREGVRHGGNLPMGQVLQNLRRRQPGRLLDAGIEQAPDGRSVYRVRWAAADGRRIDYIIDARTGAILEAEGQ
jgi:hypothetical protein